MSLECIDISNVGILIMASYMNSCGGIYIKTDNMVRALMEKPDWLDNTSDYSLARKIVVTHYTGGEVKAKFYNQSYPPRTHIPNELYNINWLPKEDKLYKCWWYWTNPSDPADSGEDILSYIEEVETEEAINLKKSYIDRINNAISKLPIETIENLVAYIEDL